MQNTAARKRKQVPEGCLVVGVDPHKKRHAAVAITPTPSQAKLFLGHEFVRIRKC
jgi:hypothetical protein